MWIVWEHRTRCRKLGLTISEVKLKGDGQGGNPSPIDKTTKIMTYVSSIQPSTNSIYCSLVVDGNMTSFLTDSGAQISLLPATHQAVQKRLEQIEAVSMQPATVDGTPIPLR